MHKDALTAYLDARPPSMFWPSFCGAIEAWAFQQRRLRCKSRFGTLFPLKAFCSFGRLTSDYNPHHSFPPGLRDPQNSSTSCSASAKYRMASSEFIVL